MKPSVRALLDSDDFRGLVMRRWRVSIVLSGLLFLLYYGYILLIATTPQLLSRRLGGGATTLGIVLAAGVIVGAWALTAAYVVWANRHYDPEVARLRARVHGD